MIELWIFKIKIVPKSFIKVKKVPGEKCNGFLTG